MQKKVGIIGLGSMGGMLLRGFISKGAVSPQRMIVSTLTPQKLEQTGRDFPGIRIASDNITVAQDADLLFLCVKPLQINAVLKEILPGLRPGTHVVSIAGCVTLRNLATLYDGPVTKLIPSVTSEVGEGISLVCHNEKVSRQDRDSLEDILSSISTVKNIVETDFEVATDLTSCAPGLISAIFREFVREALQHIDLSEQEVNDMVISTLYGTAKLIYDKKLSFSETLKRVATKGGITEEGAKVLQTRLPEVFRELFRVTLAKHELNKNKICAQFDREK